METNTDRAELVAQEVASSEDNTRLLSEMKSQIVLLREIKSALEACDIEIVRAFEVLEEETLDDIFGLATMQTSVREGIRKLVAWEETQNNNLVENANAE